MAEHLKIAPNICSCVDEEKHVMNVEICIPGVNRKDIKLFGATSAPTGAPGKYTCLSVARPGIGRGKVVR